MSVVKWCFPCPLAIVAPLNKGAACHLSTYRAFSDLEPWYPREKEMLPTKMIALFKTIFESTYNFEFRQKSKYIQNI